MEIILVILVALLSAFVGFELINKVPATLHTPLMSATNAISGITIIGALQYAALSESQFIEYLALFAAFLATLNVVGGYFVTDRMLKMFKREKR